MISDVRFFNKLNMKQTERAALSFGNVVHQDDVHASTSSHSTASLRSLPGGRDGCYLRLLGGAPVRWRSWFISQSSLRFIGNISYIYIYSSRNFEPFITGEAPPNDNDNSNLNDSNDTNYVTHGTGKSALAGFRLFIVGIMWLFLLAHLDLYLGWWSQWRIFLQGVETTKLRNWGLCLWWWPHWMLLGAVPRVFTWDILPRLHWPHAFLLRCLQITKASES